MNRHGARCQYISSGGGRCVSFAEDRLLLDLQLCPNHYHILFRKILRDVAQIPDLQQKIRTTIARIDNPKQRLKRDLPAASLIYFVRRGHHIKIGVTTDIGRRMRELERGANMAPGMRNTSCELLHVQPGTVEDETRLHSEFMAYRIAGTEWFDDRPRLLARINELKESGSHATKGDAAGKLLPGNTSGHSTRGDAA